jgi:hypothetical protein
MQNCFSLKDLYYKFKIWGSPLFLPKELINLESIANFSFKKIMLKIRDKGKIFSAWYWGGEGGGGVGGKGGGGGRGEKWPKPCMHI